MPQTFYHNHRPIHRIVTQRALCRPGKGLLAMDESPASCDARLAALGMEKSAANRHRWRDVLLTTPGLERYISGFILHEDTFQNHRVAVQVEEAGEINKETSSQARSSSEYTESAAASLARRGIVPGVKVDRGLQPLPHAPGHAWAAGLDDLAARCSAHYAAGARFAKWRTLLRVGAEEGGVAVAEAAHGLGRYASVAQSCGLVPVIEPEIALEGEHDIDAALATGAAIWAATFKSLADHGVLLEGAVLKPSMVTPGNQHGNPASPETVRGGGERVGRGVSPDDFQSPWAT